jgi:hypothetical protein
MKCFPVSVISTVTIFPIKFSSWGTSTCLLYNNSYVLSKWNVYQVSQAP